MLNEPRVSLIIQPSAPVGSEIAVINIGGNTVIRLPNKRLGLRFIAPQVSLQLPSIQFKLPIVHETLELQLLVGIALRIQLLFVAELLGANPLLERLLILLVLLLLLLGQVLLVHPLSIHLKGLLVFFVYLIEYFVLDQGVRLRNSLLTFVFID